jgi:8-oxo-dGTP diphosphatase
MHCQKCGGRTEERMNDGRLRPVCVDCGAVTYLDPKLAAAVVIARGDKILLGRRGPGAARPGLWSFPAGFVERGERVEDAAIRETREEVGLDISIDRLLGLYSKTGETVALAVYAATADEGEAAASDDLDAVGWFGLNELPPLAFDHDAEIISEWRKLVRNAPKKSGKCP